MEKATIDSFQVIGISRRTSNQNNQAAKDIGALWEQWKAGNLSAKVPHLISQEFYCIYTNYEGDYLAPYEVILGHKVSSLEQIPEGFVGHTVAQQPTVTWLAKGESLGQAVGAVWQEIWESSLDRAYQSDFELYSLDFSQATIFVGVED